MRRSRVGEVMDQPGLDPAAHEHALRSLNRANRLFGEDRRMWNAVRGTAGDGCSILDIGCGGGGFLSFAAEAMRNGPSGPLLGIDRSAEALRFARARRRGILRGLQRNNGAPGYQDRGIHWLAADALRLPFADRSIDVVTCSLFLHHFDAPEAVIILGEAARVARRAVVVGELVRSWPAWLATYAVTRIISRSWVFHTDGPRSARAAFRAGELRELARQAGLESARVRRAFPFRYIMVWQRPGPDAKT